MLSSKFVRPAGFVVGAGTALTAFGVAAPAHAAVDCSTGVTINADELALRTAISDGETLICVNPGMIDMSSGGFGEAEAINIDNQDLHLVALGEVVFDGGGEARNAIVSFGSGDEDLTVDGFTFTDFYNVGGDFNTLGVVSLDGSTGALTVLNSTFTSNVGYSIVSTLDSSNEGLEPSLTIDNSYFEGNSAGYGSVWGYGSIEVTNSTFIGEDNDGGVISAENAAAPVTAHGNLFAANLSSNSIINLSAVDNAVYNNTFVENFSNSTEDGSAITFQTDATGFVAFNTFKDNFSDYEVGNVHLVGANTVSFYGNVFDTQPDETATTGFDAEIIDGGGNVASNASDELVFTDASSLSGATSEEIALDDAADNGGPTWTMALGAESVARDIIEAGVVSDDLGSILDVDQRGESRGNLLDAGAWDSGDSSLAATGIEPLGIALTGGVLGASGAALVVRRRRKA